MNRHSILVACTLALGVATGASAQQLITGTVVRVDPPASVIVLDDGRMFQTSGETAILVNNQPILLGAVQPGTRVVLRQARPVMLQDGRYILVADPAPSGVVVTPAPVVTAPVAVVPPPPIVVREGVVAGTVARVDAAAGQIVLTDHRVVQVTPHDVVLIDDRPMPLGAVPIGSTIVIRSDTPMSALPGYDSSRDHTGAREQAP